jgi:thiol:disulfide interchange protein DsbA
MTNFIARTALLLLLAAACAARAQVPVAGRDYQVLDPPRPIASGQQIEVIEFFYYGCPVCYETQPHLARWLLKTAGDVVLRRVPATGAEGGESFALTFYALEATGDLARLHWPVYDNHHFDDKRLHQEARLLEWLRGNGVDAERVRELRNSAEVKARVAAAEKTFDAYNVRGVPAFAVDGRYLTSARMAGSVRQMMNVVEHLVSLARDERRRK